MTTLEEHIGAMVAAYRGDMSMQKLGAALAPFLGKPWTRQAVWAAENGKRTFTAAELLALAAALDVTLPQLLESAEPVLMPSGERIHEVALGALLMGRSDHAERSLRLRKELRGMEELQRRLNTLSLVHAAQIQRVRRAIAGDPEPEDSGGGGTIGAAVSVAMRMAKEMTEPRAPKSVSFETIEGERDE